MIIYNTNVATAKSEDAHNPDATISLIVIEFVASNNARPQSDVNAMQRSTNDGSTCGKKCQRSVVRANKKPVATCSRPSLPAVSTITVPLAVER